MNAYVFDIFISPSIVLENMDEDGIYTTSCKHSETKQFNPIKVRGSDFDLMLTLTDSQGEL